MKTQIFPSYSAFLDRADKKLNGVSQSFAAGNPEFEKQNATNEACWNCSDCSYCSHCSYCSDCSDCSYCSHCSYCWNCSDCSYCSHCSYCSYCRDCSHCRDCSYCRDCCHCSYCSYCSYCTSKEKTEGDKKAKSDHWSHNIPVIPNIHQAILAAVEAPGCLNMKDWHSCETTHCRGGWVVHKAGAAGYALEKATGSTQFAASQIYKASSPIRVSPVRFFETDEVAMADIKRCAAEEAKLNAVAK